MKKQSIKKNYVLNTLYQILTLITPLITAPYVSRVLGAEGVGVYSYTSSVVAFFSLFACLGTAVYGQRSIALYRDDDYIRSKVFWEIEILSVITTMVCTVAWIIFVLICPEYKLYFMILSLNLISAALDISWLYSGLEQYQFIVVRNTAVKIISICLIFLLVKTAQDLWIYVAIMAIAQLLGNASMWIPLRSIVCLIPIHTLDIKPHFKETFAYFIPTAASTVYTYLDKVMLGGLTGSTLENGYYEQANKIVKMGYTVIISLNTVMSPRISYLFAQKKQKEVQELLDKALGLILFLSCPIMFGLIGISSNFVPWFFGNGYDKVALLMIISSPLVIILSLHNFLSAQYLIPSGQRVRSTKGVLLGAAINFILNVFLIPRIQSVGALVASLIAETSICIVYWYMSKDYIPVSILLRYVPKQIFASVCMLVVVLLIARGHSGNIMITFVQIVVGGCVYVGCLLVLRERVTMRIIKYISNKLNKK